jgi:erythromycin esterase
MSSGNWPFETGRHRPSYETIDGWIAQEAISFSVDPPETFNAAVDKVIASLDDSVEVLGVGEALHGGRDILTFRNRLFQRVVEAHGYSAIAIESSFPRAHLVNEYVSGRGPASYEAVQDDGFSHGFGRLAANRQLVEWMRRYNEHGSHGVKVEFHGFDSPTEMMVTDSPQRVLNFVLDYLSSIEGPAGQERQQRIGELLGQDCGWEDPAAMLDPAKSMGDSPAARALRIETEDLISELHLRRPELVMKSGERRYREACHYAAVGRQLLNYHAAVARASGSRFDDLLGIRDASMADNLAYLVSRQRGRGKVLAFAHNSHLRRGKAHWTLGADEHSWWSAGAHLNSMLGHRYAVIGSAVGESEANGVGQPETGTLEARLTAVAGPARLIPTRAGVGLPASEIAACPIRSGSAVNPSYFPLTPQSLRDFDWLVTLDSTA